MTMFSLDSISVPENGVIVDLGMFQGEFARAAIQKFDPKWFLGVEMLEDRARALQENPMFHDPPDRLVAHCAVGDENKSTKLYRVPKWEASSSLLPINPKSSEWYGRELKQNLFGEGVAMCTLDYLCQAQNIHHIDLLKIDVQGYESRVLRGAEKILARTRTVIIEILLCEHYFDQSAPGEIESILVGAGFNGPMWLWSCPQEGDAIFTRNL